MSGEPRCRRSTSRREADASSVWSQAGTDGNSIRGPPQRPSPRYWTSEPVAQRRRASRSSRRRSHRSCRRPRPWRRGRSWSDSARGRRGSRSATGTTSERTSGSPPRSSTGRCCSLVSGSSGGAPSVRSHRHEVSVRAGSSPAITRNRPGRSAEACAPVPRPCSMPPCVPVCRWARDRTTATTSTAIHSDSMPRCPRLATAVRR